MIICKINLQILFKQKRENKNMKTAMLASNDFTGITFWLISMALLASTVFFSWKEIQ